MLPGWQIVDMSSFSGTLSIRQHVVYADEERAGAVADISGLLLGPEVRVTAGALARLAEAGIGVSMLAHRARGAATMIGPSGHDRVALRHRQQAEAGRPAMKRLWRAIVRAKIEAQAANLEVAESRKLLGVASSVKSGDTSNVEGRAARLYWTSLRPLPSWRRDPLRRDPWNIALNYGYGVLRNHTYAAVFAAGLWPTYGIHHRHRSNPACLVDDLLEPFRPLTDRVVFREIRSVECLTPEHKRRLAGVLEKETPSGQLVRAAVNSWAQAVGVYFETPGRGVPKPPIPISPIGGCPGGETPDVDNADV